MLEKIKKIVSFVKKFFMCECECQQVKDIESVVEEPKKEKGKKKTTKQNHTKKKKSIKKTKKAEK